MKLYSNIWFRIAEFGRVRSSYPSWGLVILGFWKCSLLVSVYMSLAVLFLT